MAAVSTDKELTGLVRSLVRECSFDFKAVAARVRECYAEIERTSGLKPHEKKFLNISTSECRSFFAADYLDTDQNAPIIEEPQSFEDVVHLQRRIEERSRASHARVFERVRASLGIDPGTPLAAEDEVMIALQSREEERKRSEEIAMLKKREAEEEASLRADRARLRNRFNDDSIDAEGVDPLAELQSEGRKLKLGLFLEF